MGSCEESGYDRGRSSEQPLSGRLFPKTPEPLTARGPWKAARVDLISLSPPLRPHPTCLPPDPPQTSLIFFHDVSLPCSSDAAHPGFLLSGPCKSLRVKSGDRIRLRLTSLQKEAHSGTSFGNHHHRHPTQGIEPDGAGKNT